MLCTELERQSILSRLSGYRYTHTLGCERAAKMLAERYGGDVEKAGFAAILHDITKRLSKEEQLYLCDKYGIIPCDIEKIEWKMLHGKRPQPLQNRNMAHPKTWYRPSLTTRLGTHI